MPYQIRKVAVIGAGTMGAGIAAHVANAGLPVDLLDVVPEAQVRETVRQLAARTPPPLFGPEAAALIRAGNLDEHFDRLAEADWIVEAVVERLDVKRALLARLEAVRRSDAIVSTNTSGLPIRAITKPASPELKAHFLGTHFFNPPRYMRLLELIPGAETRSDVVEAMSSFASHRLGKGVARCKDTPNFVANRYAAMAGALALNATLVHDLTVEEVDAITGPLLGRPKTATFRLFDLVGVDVALFVNRNLHALVPDDERRDALVEPATVSLLERMVGAGLLGEKAGGGFYRKLPRERGGAILTLDLQSLEYRERREPSLPSLAEAARLRSSVERWQHLLEQDDRAGALVRAIRQSLAYMSCRIPAICDDYPTVDRVVRWGFNHDLGPFELWDGLGLKTTLDAFDREGTKVGDWVRALVSSGHERFYVPDASGTRYFDLATSTLVAEPAGPGLSFGRLRGASSVVKSSRSASLVDLGDDVLGLEVHSKLNTLDDDLVGTLEEGLALLEGRWHGLVIGTDAPDFGVGANLARLLQAVAAGGAAGIESVVAAVQRAMQAVRTAPKPVVAAPVGRVLGGSCELVLASTGAVAAAETYMGLVEVGVGLLPAAGGCKEMVRRLVSPAMTIEGADPLPALKRVLETLGLAKVSSSAVEARSFGYLSAADPVVMNRDELLSAARAEILRLAARGYRPSVVRANCYAAGRQMAATLEAGLFLLEQSGRASAHDRLVVSKVARVICGGDLTSPQWVDEQYLLDLEREAFVSLCGEPKTRERIEHVLKTGKPLRN